MSNPPQSPLDWEAAPPPGDDGRGGTGAGRDGIGAGRDGIGPTGGRPADETAADASVRAGGTDGIGADRASRPRRRVDAWTVIRVLVMAFGLATLARWGYLSWPYPMPALGFIIGAPLFAALVWFFFRSPRSPIRTDAVGKTIVEVALVIAAGAAWVSIGRPWIGLVFVVVAGVSGIVVGRRETAA